MQPLRDFLIYFFIFFFKTFLTTTPSIKISYLFSTKLEKNWSRLTSGCGSLQTAKQCVFKYATREQSNKRSGTRLKTESETWGETLKRACEVRLLRHALPISLLIFRKKPTVLQSRFTVINAQRGAHHIHVLDLITVLLVI